MMSRQPNRPCRRGNRTLRRSNCKNRRSYHAIRQGDEATQRTRCNDEPTLQRVVRDRSPSSTEHKLQNRQSIGPHRRLNNAIAASNRAHPRSCQLKRRSYQHLHAIIPRVTPIGRVLGRHQTPCTPHRTLRCTESCAVMQRAGNTIETSDRREPTRRRPHASDRATLVENRPQCDGEANHRVAHRAEWDDELERSTRQATSCW